MGYLQVGHYFFSGEELQNTSWPHSLHISHQGESCGREQLGGPTGSIGI